MVQSYSSKKPLRSGLNQASILEKKEEQMGFHLKIDHDEPKKNNLKSGMLPP
jgi:hypothetical protein